MALLAKRILIILAVAAIAALAFYIGGVVGFVEGQAVQLGRQAPFEAAWITRALSDLRAGRSQGAIAMLEQHLDSQLITHGVDSLLPPPRFERPGLNPALGYRLLPPVAEYRAQNPPVSEDPEVLSTLNGISLCLQKAPFDASDQDIREYLRSCYRSVW